MGGWRPHQKLPQLNLQLPDRLHWKLTFCDGDSLHPADADPEEVTNLCRKGRLALYPSALSHHPAPVVKEVHGQGQSWARRPRQVIVDPGGVLEEPIYGQGGMGPNH